LCIRAVTREQLWCRRNNLRRQRSPPLLSYDVPIKHFILIARYTTPKNRLFTVR
jgi:hypothetical protein